MGRHKCERDFPKRDTPWQFLANCCSSAITLRDLIRPVVLSQLSHRITFDFLTVFDTDLCDLTHIPPWTDADPDLLCYMTCKTSKTSSRIRKSSVSHISRISICRRRVLHLCFSPTPNSEHKKEALFLSALFQRCGRRCKFMRQAAFETEALAEQYSVCPSIMYPGDVCGAPNETLHCLEFRRRRWRSSAVPVPEPKRLGVQTLNSGEC